MQTKNCDEKGSDIGRNLKGRKKMVGQNQWKILGGGKKSSIKLGWQISACEYPSFDACGLYILWLMYVGSAWW